MGRLGPKRLRSCERKASCSGRMVGNGANPIEGENSAGSVDPCDRELGFLTLDRCDNTRRRMPFEPLDGTVQLRPVTLYGYGKGRRTNGCSGARAAEACLTSMAVARAR